MKSSALAGVFPVVARELVERGYKFYGKCEIAYPGGELWQRHFGKDTPDAVAMDFVYYDRQSHIVSSVELTAYFECHIPGKAPMIPFKIMAYGFKVDELMPIIGIIEDSLLIPPTTLGIFSIVKFLFPGSILSGQCAK